MWRALVFIALLALAAFAAVWLADRPGTVLVTWGKYEASTSVAVAAVLTVGTAFLLALLWSALNFLKGLPGRLTFASRAKKRARGYQSVSRGMVAVGAGDPLAARRYAAEAKRLLGEEPLTLLLAAQAAQVSGDRPAAERAFRRLVEDPETRVLGLRGLFVEARRRGESAAALDYASEAARLAPAASWANDAVLEAQCTAGDWRGAIAALERRASLGLIDRPTARRHRAVLLTAEAQALAERDQAQALQSAQEAVKLAPDLVPAAVVAGTLLSRRGDLRRAAKTVERAWRTQPHPELADVYLNLRPGDSSLDRMRRAETLAKLSSWDPESRIALARAALDARDFARARSALQPILSERPTARACLLMADIEQAEHGATGRVREWVTRASRAPRDPAWIADGVVSDRWGPVSPVSGRLDAFVWQAPPDVLSGPSSPVDDVVADLDDKPRPPPAIEAGKPEPARAPAAVEIEPPPPVERPRPEAVDVSVPAKPVVPPKPPETARPAPEPIGAAEPAVPPSPPVSPAKPADAKVDAATKKALGTPLEGEGARAAGSTVAAPPRRVSISEARPSDPLRQADGRPAAPANGAGSHAAEPARVVFPVEHAPDDPGPEAAEPKGARFRLFG